MQRLRLCNVSDRYISYLRSKNQDVYDNKSETRIHMRKYLGVVLSVNGYNYFVPLSSPKKTDYQKAGEEYVIKKSIIPIIRMTRKNRAGEKELMGTLRISHMIPIPESELVEYNISDEADEKYKNLIENELKYIMENRNRIMNNARVMYKQKCSKEPIGYVDKALDYEELENICNEYMNKNSC